MGIQESVEFTIEGSLRRGEDGSVFIDLVPSLVGRDLTDQQILDSVVDLLLWQGSLSITDTPIPESLDS